MGTVDWSFNASDSFELSSPDESELPDLDLSTLGGFTLDVPLAPPTRRKRINLRRVEIEQLRVEAVRLEAEINQLQRRQVRQKPVPVLEPDVFGVAWQRMAKRQLQQLRRAEAENRKLKDRVREQKRMIRLLRQHLAACSSPHWSFSAPQPSQYFMPVDPGGFTFITAGIYQMLTLTDSVMRDPRLQMLSTAFRDVKVDPLGSDGVAVQTLDSTIVPFDVTSTSGAVLRRLMEEHGPAPSSWTKTGSELLLAEVMTSLNVGGFIGQGHAKMAISCVQNDNRVIIARLTVFTELEGVAHDQLVQLPLRHCHWTVIEKPTTVTSNQNEFCQLKSCSLCLVDLVTSFTKDRPHQHKRDIVARICTDIAAATLDEMHEGVDNWLLGTT